MKTETAQLVSFLHELKLRSERIERAAAVHLNTVQIGNQVWAQENLKVVYFRNGDPVPLVEMRNAWAKLETPAYCVAENGDYLYNGYAVFDPRGLAPRGYHVASEAEWQVLVDEVNKTFDPKALKLVSAMERFSIFKKLATANFSVKMTYRRCGDFGEFSPTLSEAHWWTSTRLYTALPVQCWLNNYKENLFSGLKQIRNGLVVRCVKDA
jgi:uncharacterized protein (TIGR02145 family)